MTQLNQKIGFFGAGKMATALAKGILDAGICSANELLASDVEPKQRHAFEHETGIKTTSSNTEVAQFCDASILAVKPDQVHDVLTSIRKTFGQKLLISIAAGMPISTLEAKLEDGARVIRVMPNTPALVRCGASAFAPGQFAKTGDLQIAETIFNAIGLAFKVPEKLLDAVTGLSGSGPAYVFLILEALADGGVEMGLPRDVAQKLACQTVLGAATLALQTQRHPGELKDMVASPGGTTIEGLRVLEEHKLRAALMNAVRAATEKSIKLGSLK